MRIGKIIILLVLFSLNINVFAQIHYMTGVCKDMPQSILENVDKMGMDKCSELTELEGLFFNFLYKNIISQSKKEGFDFCGKKTGFIRGNAGTIKSDKKEYFSTERLAINYNDTICFGTLYIFDTVQKEKSGGYDAAIVSCSSKKRLTIKEVIKVLKKAELRATK